MAGVALQPASYAPDRLAYVHHPRWQRLLDRLQIHAEYDICAGTELYTTDGRTILDFDSGGSAHNTGHNHPSIAEAIKDELSRCGASLVRGHGSALAGQFAMRLCEKAGDGLEQVFFAGSAGESIDTAIQFARRKTGRTALLAASGAYHGNTAGGRALAREGDRVPFGDLAAARSRLAGGQYAAFFLEPVQSEGGVRIPPDDYLGGVEETCRRYGTLLVLDEAQTGLYRTGTFLAAHHFRVTPDMVILGTGLGGGILPLSALLVSDPVYRGAFDSVRRGLLDPPGAGLAEHRLALRAGLATLDVFEREALGQQALRWGRLLRHMLQVRLGRYSMVREIRGLGLLTGVEFQTPGELRLRVPFETLRRVHPGLFGISVVSRLFRDWNCLTQICWNQFMVLKSAPPLVVREPQLHRFVEAIGAVADLIHSSSGSFWTGALAMALRGTRL